MERRFTIEFGAIVKKGRRAVRGCSIQLGDLSVKIDDISRCYLYGSQLVYDESDGMAYCCSITLAEDLLTTKVLIHGFSSTRVAVLTQENAIDVFNIFCQLSSEISLLRESTLLREGNTIFPRASEKECTERKVLLDRLNDAQEEEGSASDWSVCPHPDFQD